MIRFGRQKNKYGAKRVECACEIGMHPSMLERSVCQFLEMRAKAGEIRNIKRQATVRLAPGCTWKVDFRFEYVKTGATAWAEAKGAWDKTSSLKLRMWRENGPGELEIWRGHHRRPTLVEVVTPKGGTA